MPYLKRFNKHQVAAVGFAVLFFAPGCTPDFTSPVAPEFPAVEPIQSVASSFVTVQVDAFVTGVTDTTGTLGGAVATGDAIHGEYTYDVTVADSHHKPEIGRYMFTSAPSGISFSVSGLLFRSDPGAVDMTIKLLDNKKPSLIRDSYQVASVSNLGLGPGVGVASIVLTLEDDTGSALSSDALADAPVNLGAWSSAMLVISGANSGWRVDAVVTVCAPGGGTTPVSRPGGVRKLTPDKAK